MGADTLEENPTVTTMKNMLCFPEFLHVFIVNVFPCNIVLINVHEYEYTEMWI